MDDPTGHAVLRYQLVKHSGMANVARKNQTSAVLVLSPAIKQFIDDTSVALLIASKVCEGTRCKIVLLKYRVPNHTGGNFFDPRFGESVTD